MYARRIKGRHQRWSSVFQPSKYLFRPNCSDHTYSRSLSHISSLRNHSSHDSSIRRYLSDSFISRGIAPGHSYTGSRVTSSLCFKSIQLRAYSSEGDGRNASENSHKPINDGAKDKGKIHREKVGEDVRRCDTHAQLGEQEQKEWLHNEKLSIESKKRESPFLTRREKFKNEFLRRVVPWEKINISWETFPYYIHEHSKNLLVECTASHLKHKKFTANYGARLTSSSGRILLQSVPGTELYRERLVRALARDLQVPLLVLDSSILAPYDFGDDCSSDCESDDNLEMEECTSESEVEDENDAGNEEWTSSNEAKTDCSDDDEADLEATAVEALKKLVPYNLEEFEKKAFKSSQIYLETVVRAKDAGVLELKRFSREVGSSSESSKSEVADPSDNSKQPLRKGDRVKYVGPSVHIEADNRIILGKILTSDGPKNAYTVIPGRPLSSGQRGEVYEVNGDRVAVILDIVGDSKVNEGEKDDKVTEQLARPPVYWIDEDGSSLPVNFPFPKCKQTEKFCTFTVKDIEHDLDTQAEDCYIAMQALCEVLHSMQPLIVYFPDSSQWLSRAVPRSNRKDFVRKVQEMFDQLSGPVVLICGQNKVATGSKEKEKFPLPLKNLTEGLKGTKRSDDDNEIYKLFTNVLCIYPPKEEDFLRTFNKQVEEDRRIVIYRSNINELHKVLEEHELSCVDLLHVRTDGVILTKRRCISGDAGWTMIEFLFLEMCLAIIYDL
ncbi:hypothetical protein EZV62_018211 [Acer yangbiense]|uniref:Uncharacterized protein n=1 Tax=Acer yangbiense TaxID=1000413 RepID=A0A5C7HJ53_9ROSI|nr:hypothetical protein EZV62_018211 [Acer yangbiense]